MSLSFDNTQIAFQYRTNKDLKLAHFVFNSMSSPLLTKIGMKLASWTIRWNLPFQGIIKSTVFKQFCGGEDLHEAAQTASVLAKYDVGVALDYGVEGKQSEEEYDRAVPEFIKAIEYAATQPNIPFIPVKLTGFARFGLLERVHSEVALLDSEQAEWERVTQRIDRICAAAAAQHIKILIDAEESWIQIPVDKLADAMMAKYNRHALVVFNTFQMYRHDRLAFLQQSLSAAVEKGYLLGVKLVRGAYMEKERSRAAQLQYPDPIQPDKSATDRDYDDAVAFCLAHVEQLGLFIGTHNEHSCLNAARIMNDRSIPADHPHVFFSQLYGMSDNITFNLAHHGYHASKYLPYGPVKDVIPYLMRRAAENSSVAGQTGRELSLIRKEMRRRGL